jgi:8-oxo-dGTP pyrophosphatase MutT (NUDIX family)
MITAAGCIFLSTDTGRVMLQHRSGEVNHPRTWGFFGGKSDNGEKPIDTLYREIEEELGLVPDIKKVIPINKFTSPNKKFIYHSFVVTIDEEFIPILNNESDGYCWVKIGNLPRPLHPGAKIQCNSKQFVKKIKTVYEQHSRKL